MPLGPGVCPKRLRISFMQFTILDKSCSTRLKEGLRLTPAWSVPSLALYFYWALCPSYYTRECDGFAMLSTAALLRMRDSRQPTNYLMIKADCSTKSSPLRSW
ncbi:hypothetical protein EJ02DRAFT_58400 [Clathrospora elynae]|uniref:Uncharacterized protein n=1 Tax=Clathrospora elynae TaxID=706981 RepID=A0A6A5SYS7_9PLEO|nr:hypothetical protein EJ02DRAFT_58400 [Clathrospora elynae]